MKETFAMLKDLGVNVDHLHSFHDSFWGLAGKDIWKLQFILEMCEDDWA